MLALILVAMMSAVLFGSLSMAAKTWDRGEDKASRTSEMRLTEEFLRRTLGNAYPPRDLNNLDAPVSFQGAEDWIAFPALLPDRFGGELLYFKLGLAGGGEGRGQSRRRRGGHAAVSAKRRLSSNPPPK